MIVLDTIELPDLRWSDELAAGLDVGQSVRRRLDGGVVVFTRAHHGGRAITLEATEDHWLTRAQANAVAALAAVPGAVYELSLREVPYQVMFRHHDTPVLDLMPLVDYADAEDADPFIGQIKLMTA